MGVYVTLYPSGHSWQSIFTFDGPSMVTDRAPDPALHVFTMKSEGTPVKDEMYWVNVRAFVLTLVIGCLVGWRHTCSSPLQSGPKSSHHSWISRLAGFPYTDLEGTAWDVTPVKTDINGVDAVLPWNKPYGVFICTNRHAMLNKFKSNLYPHTLNWHQV